MIRELNFISREHAAKQTCHTFDALIGKHEAVAAVKQIEENNERI